MKITGYMVTAIIVICLLLAGVLILFPNILPKHLIQDSATRFSAAQIISGTAIGAAALLLAYQDYVRNHKKADLRIVLKIRGSDIQYLGGTDVIKISKLRSSFSLFAIDDKMSYGKYKHKDEYQPFDELIFSVENKGDAVARWVKVKITVDDPAEIATLHLLGSSIHKNLWRSVSTPENSEYQRLHHSFEFNVGENFVIHNHPPKITDLKEWVSEIGSFELIVPWNDDELDNRSLKIKCYIEADGVARTANEFVFQTAFQFKENWIIEPE